MSKVAIIDCIFYLQKSFDNAHDFLRQVQEPENPKVNATELLIQQIS